MKLPRVELPRVELPGEWRPEFRPGYFGRRRDEKVAGFDAQYGAGNWKLMWLADGFPAMEFEDACIYHYEESYVRWLQEYPENLDILRSYGECIDNAPTNVNSGCDYTIQEAFSTHIQDIAVRNAMRILGVKFEGDPSNILVIRSADSNGFVFGPGNVPFWKPELISSPSKCPHWANTCSVEDFWQSNKWLMVRRPVEVN